MSAKRYSGNATITLSIDETERRGDRQNYHVMVTQGRSRYRTDVSAPIVGGSGVGIDSPQMYDAVAASALAFGVDDGALDADDLDFAESGYAVRRRK